MAHVAEPMGQLYLRITSPQAIARAASLCPSAVSRSTRTLAPSRAIVSPALSARSATATLSCGASFIAPRTVVARSEFSILVVSGHRVHAADERTTHVALGGHYFLGLRYRLFGASRRNDNHAVAVAKQVITRGDGDRADGHGLAVAIRNPARDDIRRGQKGAEHWEPLLEHEIGVARTTIDDVAEHAPRGKSLRG